MPVIVIAPTTAAVTVPVPVKGSRPGATLAATGLTGVEKIVILFSCDGGETYETMTKDGADAVLSLTNKIEGVYSHFRIAVTKPITASPVGVYLSNDVSK